MGFSLLRRSLRLRLLVGVLAIDLLLGAVFTYSAIRVIRDWVASDVVVDARAFDHLIVASAAPLLAELNLGALQELINEAHASGNLAYVTIREAASGRVLAKAGKAPDAAIVRSATGSAAGEAVPQPQAHGGAYHFGSSITLGGRAYGQLEFGLSSRAAEQSVQALWRRAVGISGVGLAVSALLLLLLTGIVTAGLAELAVGARRVGAGEPNVQVAVRGEDEIAQVGAAFNVMSARLAERIEALAQSETVQRGLIESLNEGVLLRQADGGLLAFNPAACRLLALTEGQLRGDEPLPSGWRLCDETGADLSLSAPMRLAADPQPKGVERQLELRLPDGQRRWLSVNVTALPTHGQAELTVTAFGDITAYLQAQQRLRDSNADLEQRVQARTAELAAAVAQAEGANRAKSEFMSRMSHELRTPLNAILGFAQLIPSYEATSVRTKEAAGHIARGGWHLLELIDEVLDLSRIETGTMRVDRVPVDLTTVVEECIQLLRPQAQSLGVTLAHSLTPGLSVMGDRTRLRQVLTNLLSNAVKYNRSGGSVTVQAGAQPPAGVVVTVRDTGIGLTREQIARLFSPFDRLGAERSSVTGTGIGLVITRRLVELMGGSVAVASTPNEGTTVTLQLQGVHTNSGFGALQADPPVASSAAQAMAPASLGAARQRILYVEDDATNARVMAEALGQRRDWELEVAPSAAAGLAQAHAAPPALFIIDGRLPDIDGAELCRLLRASTKFRHTPMIAVTANAMPDDVASGLAAGFDAYITKPFELPHLLAQIDRLLAMDGHNARD